MPDAVLFQTDGPVCTILLNRPECRNAVDGPTAAALLAAFERFEADDALRVAVLGGTGGHFCSGADLTAVGDPSRRNHLDPDGGAPGPPGPPGPAACPAQPARPARPARRTCRTYMWHICLCPPGLAASFP